MGDFKDFILERFSKVNLDNLAYCPHYRDDYYDEIIEDDGWVIFDLIANEVGAEWVRSGASKVVFAFAEYPDVVVKIPFIGNGVYDDNNIFLYEDHIFDGVQNCWGGESWNYCQYEADLYKEACKRDLGRFFFSTEELCTIGDTQFYVSDRANTEFEYGIVTPSGDSWNKAKWAYKTSPINEDCLAVLYEQNPTDEVDELIDFLNEYYLNDFHWGNLGYNDDNYLCLLDYSGYKE